MYWIDGYADLYQEVQGFEIVILRNKELGDIDAYLSMKQSTRSTYDIAMRDATIDGLITMEDISLLKPSQLFYKKIDPNEIFIIQAVNKLEQQPKTKNMNAIKQNSSVTVFRKQYVSKKKKELYVPVHENVVSFMSLQNKDEKNFAAGLEDNTIINIQIPKIDFVNNVIYDVKISDRILVRDYLKSRKEYVKVESVDAYGVPGVIRIQGTFDTRTGDNEYLISNEMSSDYDA